MDPSTDVNRLLQTVKQCFNSHDYTTCKRLLLQLAGSYKRLGNGSMECQMYYQLGVCHYRTHEYGEAIRVYKQAVDLVGTDELLLSCVLHGELASAYQAMGSLQQAKRHSNVLLSLSQGFRSLLIPERTKLKAWAAGIAGSVHQSLNQHDFALNFLQTEFELEQDETARVITRRKMGISCTELQRFSEAEEHLLGSLWSAVQFSMTADIFSACILLGALYSRWGKSYWCSVWYEQAKELLDDSESEAITRQTGKVYAGLAQVALNLGDLEAAGRNACVAVQGFRDTEDIRGMAQALCLLGDLYKKEDKLDLAITSHKKALAKDVFQASLTDLLQDEVFARHGFDAITFADDFKVIYDHLLECFYLRSRASASGSPEDTLSWDEQALVWSERSRSQVPISRWISKHPEQGAVDVAVAFDDDKEALRQLIGVVRQCPAGTIVIEFASCIHTDMLLTWIVKADGSVRMRCRYLEEFWDDKIDLLKSLGCKEPIIIERVVEATLKAIDRAQPEGSAASDLLRILGELLTDGLEEDLEQMIPDDLLIIVPNEVLTLVPFPALLIKKKNDPSSELQYLVQRHTIAVVPSIRLLGLLCLHELDSDPRNHILSDSILVVGNPQPIANKLVEADSNLANLPGAEMEAGQISLLLRNSEYQVKLLCNEDAGDSSVKEAMMSASWIHLACHGLADKEQLKLPDAGVVLGCPHEYGSSRKSKQEGDRLTRTSEDVDEKSDIRIGLLSVREITQMNLRAKAVVVSACTSGYGRIYGDGLSGLAQAFAIAGVPTTVVSLWHVDDGATFQLMSQLYEYLLCGMNLAMAMRTAMLEMVAEEKRSRGGGLRRRRKVVELKWKLWEWAAFLVIGNPFITLPKH